MPGIYSEGGSVTIKWEHERYVSIDGMVQYLHCSGECKKKKSNMNKTKRKTGKRMTEPQEHVGQYQKVLHFCYQRHRSRGEKVLSKIYIIHTHTHIRIKKY